MSLLGRWALAAILLFESGTTYAQSPGLTTYGPAEMLAESSNLSDLTFPKAAVELGLFSKFNNVLFRPPGGASDQRYPAVVLLHRCGPFRDQEVRYWVEGALAKGYVVLPVDSLRGKTTNCNFPLEVASGRRIKDAFDAHQHLAGLPFVDSARVYVVGFSQGSFIATLASSAQVASAFGVPPTRRFAGAAGLYGHCQYPAGSIRGVGYQIDILRQDVDRPLLLLMAELDNETPPASCDEPVKQLKAKGAHIEAHIYPKTTHCWDCILSDGRARTDFRGVQITYRYDKAVTDDSRKRVFDFFSK
jgi:dienelactone hydrolase